MLSATPKISTIIPTYNCGQYIAEAIESILSQTRKEFEIIVVDDGSVDNTKDVIKRYADVGKVKYVFQENKGVAHARNRGIAEVQGEYVSFQDADDVSLPFRLEAEAFILDTHKDVELVFSPVLMFDHETKNVGDLWGGIPAPEMQNRKRTFLYLFWNGHRIPTSSVMLRRRIFDEGGRFDPSYKIGEDYHFYLSTAAKRLLFCYPKPLALIRANHSSHLTANIEATQFYEKRLLRDAFNKYREELGLAQWDYARALSNSCLRDFGVYTGASEYRKAGEKLVKSIAASPTNLRIYKELLLRLMLHKTRSRRTSRGVLVF